MRNAVLTEAEQGAIREAWKFSKYSRESIEGQLLGGSIIAVIRCLELMKPALHMMQGFRLFTRHRAAGK